MTTINHLALYILFILYMYFIIPHLPFNFFFTCSPKIKLPCFQGILLPDVPEFVNDVEKKMNEIKNCSSRESDILLCASMKSGTGTPCCQKYYNIHTIMKHFNDQFTCINEYFNDISREFSKH